MYNGSSMNFNNQRSVQGILVKDCRHHNRCNHFDRNKLIGDSYFVRNPKVHVPKLKPYFRGTHKF